MSVCTEAPIDDWVWNFLIEHLLKVLSFEFFHSLFANTFFDSLANGSLSLSAFRAERARRKEGRTLRSVEIMERERVVASAIYRALKFSLFGTPLIHGAMEDLLAEFLAVIFVSWRYIFIRRDIFV